MKTTHTPGPWQQVGNCIAGSNPAHRVALVTEAMKGKPQTQANARLIAAAPDLLAALEEVHAVLESIGYDATAEAGRARAAIAKAKG